MYIYLCKTNHWYSLKLLSGQSRPHKTNTMSEQEPDISSHEEVEAVAENKPAGTTKPTSLESHDRAQTVAFAVFWMRDVSQTRRSGISSFGQLKMSR